MKWRPTTIRARLTAWYTACLAIPLVLLAGIAYRTFERALVERTDDFLANALTAFQRELGAERRVRIEPLTAVSATIQELRFRDLAIVVIDSAGRLVALSEPIDPLAPSHVTPAALSALRTHARDSAAYTVVADSQDVRMLTRSLNDVGSGYLIGGVYPLRDVEGTLARTRATFLLAIPLLIVAAGTGGYFIAKRSLAPVAAIAARAAEIGASTLHERLPAAAPDELGRLGAVLNDLLNRLQTSFEQQRRFMADASHELRTPTAIIRAEADVTLSRPHRDEEEYRESATIVLNAARRLTRVVDDLLLAARADAGQVTLYRRELHLKDVVHEALEALRPTATARDVHLHFDPANDTPITGDPDLLGRVFLNLLDNAVRHSPTGATVQVSMESQGQNLVVSVLDHGPGIPREDWERVFERFVRLDPARTTPEHPTTGAAGLGLGIARRIMQLHGGDLRIHESRPGRTVFHASLRTA